MTLSLNELREGLPERFGGICGDCLMKGTCLGCCIAQNYYRSKDLWIPYWYCEEAKNAGLFPESRMRTMTISRQQKVGESDIAKINC